MMNVLTDILYDSSSLISSQNFKETLSQNKIISSQDMAFEQDQLNQMSVSQIHNIDQSLLSASHSDMEFYNSSNQIHLSSNTTSGFEGENDVSVFSDSFPEIVPSWLTHDFMKAADSLPSPDILSNVSEIYPSATETEQLEMLDLGFPSELSSQDVASVSESQKLLDELPIQRFSNGDSLLMTSFNDVNMTDLNSIQHHPITTHASLMTPILPCDSNLLHLPSCSSSTTLIPPTNQLHLSLHSSLTDQCLTATSSPSLSNGQSQSQPVDVVCDKLPQINLNHLNSFLEGKTNLSNIQVLHRGFQNVVMSNDMNQNQSEPDNSFPNIRITNSNQQSQPDSSYPGIRIANNNQQSQPDSSFRNVRITNSNHQSQPENFNIVNNNTHNLLSTNVILKQDASVQASENANVLHSSGCYSCSNVSSDAAIEVVQCFKCQFCDFISMHKCAVESHINSSHSKSPNNGTVGNEISDKGQSPIASATDMANSSTVSGTLPDFQPMKNNLLGQLEKSTMQKENRFQCRLCNKILSDATAYELHLLSHQDANQNYTPQTANFHCGKCNKLFLDSASITSHMMSDHNINLQPVGVSALNGFLSLNTNHLTIAPANNKQQVKSKDVSQSSKSPKGGQQKILPKESTNELPEDPLTVPTKTVSSRKKAWQMKKKRDLCSYICEFKGCNIRFRALDNLEYHKKCHVSGGSSFACPECEMTFENWGSIAGHLWRNHKNDMELHQCDKCPFRHYSLGHLERYHKKIHLDECSYLCDECGKGFKNGKQMRNHRDRWHLNPNKKKPPPPNNPLEPKCKICWTNFSSRVLLEHHEDTVHNVKRKAHMCTYCDYTSRKKSTLDMHMRQHTGEKPFKCDQCDYKTADHNSLRRHKMVHSGDKKYKCPFCPYSSIQASSYKDHMKKHPEGHNGVTFSCEMCSFKTVQRDKYILHVNDHESLKMLQYANSLIEINSAEEMYPMAEAMDVSLSYGFYNNLIPHLNQNKNMQSFFTSLGVNMVSVGQQSAT